VAVRAERRVGIVLHQQALSMAGEGLRGWNLRLVVQSGVITYTSAPVNSSSRTVL
jgi:hypothetical protein